jgi:outer membrane immunogenic protein
MQRFLLTACAGLLAAAVASPSFAADLPRPAYKAAPAVYVAPFSWSGFYVGINAGYGWGNSTWTNVLSTTGNFKTTGAVIGGTLGYNLQTGLWVWGIEGDLDWSSIKGSSNSGLYCLLQAGCETKNTWLGTVRGRIGYAWDRWLPYFTGGVAFGSVKMTPPAIFGAGETQTKTGWALGGGVEYAFMGAWSAKLEYLYVDLGTATCAAANCLLATDVKFNTSLLRVGVNYRF